MQNMSLPIAVVHPTHAVGSSTVQANTGPADPVINAVNKTMTSNVTALSFVFDRITQSLRVVITDQLSGEVLRKIEYTSMPPHTHQADKLQGLLLDRLV